MYPELLEIEPSEEVVDESELIRLKKEFNNNIINMDDYNESIITNQ